MGMPTLDLWANLLRAIGQAGIDRSGTERSGIERSDLPEVLRLSKRAVRTRLATAARHGWIEERKLGRGRATVQLTERGSDVAARWKLIEASAEKAWCEQAGPERADRLGAALRKVVAALPLEHPHYPASYGAADASITGGNGVDWKAVPRLRSNTVSDLALSALVSQVLVAFAMEYEERSPVALSLSTSVIARIPAEGRPLRGMGHSGGVSALVRHGFLRVGSDHGKELVYLTPKGHAVSAAHDERIHAIEMEWNNRFGAESMAELRSALEEATAAMSRG